MKIDNINVEEVLEDLTKRVEKLESYHNGIEKINLSYGKIINKNYPEEDEDFTGLCTKEHCIYEILILIIPKEMQGSKLIVELEGTDKDKVTATFNEDYSKLNIEPKEDFHTTITVNIYSTNKEVEGTINVIGVSVPWNPNYPLPV